MIIGGGAAGMYAAVAAAQNGHAVHLYEKNERLGKKLYITGKGRCNLTNACDADDFFAAVCTNHKFLYRPYAACTNQDVVDFFERHGCKTKVERGKRVFPASDKSADVIDALRRAMARAGVAVHLQSQVDDLLIGEGRARGIRLANGQEATGDAVIVCTGGLSYPSTGSTGDGYRLAARCGHTVEPCCPSLVPFQVAETDVARQLQGLSLRNVSLAVMDGNKGLYEGFGEMLFAHFGVSGPLVLDASAYVARRLLEKELQLRIDLKPALSEKQADLRILRAFDGAQNRQFKNVIGALFPQKLTPVMIALSGISPEKKVNVVSKAERGRLVSLIKHFPLTATGLGGYQEAVVTKGGVRVNEVWPSTMESKLVQGLYFAGEVLDLDALTGGFNLQIAWSTGHAAGIAVPFGQAGKQAGKADGRKR